MGYKKHAPPNIYRDIQVIDRRACSIYTCTYMYMHVHVHVLVHVHAQLAPERSFAFRLQLSSWEIIPRLSKKELHDKLVNLETQYGCPKLEYLSNKQPPSLV